LALTWPSHALGQKLFLMVLKLPGRSIFGRELDSTRRR
jgi:hypothetical protein